jgi:hypothetical protein
MEQWEMVAVQLQVMGIGPQRLVMWSDDGERHNLGAGEVMPMDQIVGALNELGRMGYSMSGTTTTQTPNGIDLTTYWLQRRAE